MTASRRIHTGIRRVRVSLIGDHLRRNLTRRRLCLYRRTSVKPDAVCCRYLFMTDTRSGVTDVLGVLSIIVCSSFQSVAAEGRVLTHRAE